MSKMEAHVRGGLLFPPTMVSKIGYKDKSTFVKILKSGSVQISRGEVF